MVNICRAKSGYYKWLYYTFLYAFTSSHCATYYRVINYTQLEKHSFIDMLALFMMPIHKCVYVCVSRIYSVLRAHSVMWIYIYIYLLRCLQENRLAHIIITIIINVRMWMGGRYTIYIYGYIESCSCSSIIITLYVAHRFPNKELHLCYTQPQNIVVVSRYTEKPILSREFSVQHQIL